MLSLKHHTLRAVQIYSVSWRSYSWFGEPSNWLEVGWGLKCLFAMLQDWSPFSCYWGFYLCRFFVCKQYCFDLAKQITGLLIYFWSILFTISCLGFWFNMPLWNAKRKKLQVLKIFAERPLQDSINLLNDQVKKLE